MKNRDSFESNVKAMEVAKLFGSKSMQTSHYVTIDNVLVRISNHMPDYCYLSSYNNLESLDGVLFVFTGENCEKYASQIEEDSRFSNLNFNVFCIENEDDDYDYIISTINRKINSLK